MITAGVIHAFLGVRAERRSLEDIAQPLSAAEAFQQSKVGESTGEAAEQKTRLSAGRRSTGARTQSAMPTAAVVPVNLVEDDHEVDILLRTLRQDGPASRRELARR